MTTDNIITVIVVEDEKLIAKNITKNINRFDGFQVVATLFNGIDALAAIDELAPNIVVTDICMPGMSGIELIERITDRYPNIKKIIISGYDDFAYAKAAIQHKTINYLLKPIDYNELKKTLASIRDELNLQRNDAISRLQVEDRTPERISSYIKDYLFLHYAEQVDFTSIASDLGFSLAYLTRIFSGQMGISPTRFLRQIRVSEAKTLLKDSAYSIKHVAELVAIPDPFYFSKIFKQATGMSPSEYRAQVNDQSSRSTK